MHNNTVYIQVKLFDVNQLEQVIISVHEVAFQNNLESHIVGTTNSIHVTGVGKKSNTIKRLTHFHLLNRQQTVASIDPLNIGTTNLYLQIRRKNFVTKELISCIDLLNCVITNLYFITKWLRSCVRNQISRERVVELFSTDTQRWHNSVDLNSLKASLCRHEKTDDRRKQR